MINQITTDISCDACLVQETKALVRGERKVIVNAIRCKNSIGHELVRIGRVDVKTTV